MSVDQPATEPTVSTARFPAEYGQDATNTADHLVWTDVAARIAAAKNYWMATTTPEGRPYLRPVDGVFVDNVLAFGGSPQTRWVRHLEARPEATASLPDDDHAVILEGRVELVTDAGAPLTAVVDAANVAKYPQYFSGDEPREFHPFWVLRPARVFAWSLTAFPARATRFDFGG